MKVLVCGDRNWTWRALMEEHMGKLPKGTTIVHGGARGADTLAGEIGRGLGFEVIVVSAQWEAFGRAAGPIRNREMLNLNPDKVLAFHDDLEKSKGTKDCVTEARRRGIPVEVIGHA